MPSLNIVKIVVKYCCYLHYPAYTEQSREGEGGMRNWVYEAARAAAAYLSIEEGSRKE